MKRISTRLIVSFLLVTLLPALPLSLVVHDLLERRFGPAISDPLELALDAGLTESRGHLKELRLGLDNQAALLATGPFPHPVILLDQSGSIQPADSLAHYLAARPDLENQAKGVKAPARRLADGWLQWSGPGGPAGSL